MGIRSIRTAFFAGVISIGLIGCEKPLPAQAPASVPAPAGLPTGYWQAYITLPGGDIETGIELSRDGAAYRASLINGQERVRIDEVSFNDGELLLRFSAFNNEIRATLVDGQLRGELTARQALWRYPGYAVHGNAWQRSQPGIECSIQAGPVGTMGGHVFTSLTAVIPRRSASSHSAGSRLFGTFLNPNGDHRFLAGHVRGNEFHLSTFDGAHAFIFSGRINATGSIEKADFWSGTSWHQTWSAERNNSVELPDAFSRTFLKPGYDKFEFEFPNEDGVTVSLDDEKFKDKVVLVTIAGTWCPNCNDEARFLAPFYKQYRNQGLEVVALLFEHFEDTDLAAQQVRLFRQKFDIQYDTLIAGISDKTEAGKTLPASQCSSRFPDDDFYRS